MNEELSALVESADIAEYIGQYVDLFEKDGELWGLSPFKDEKTPSFSIRPEQNVFYDFSSGKGGNIVDFIRYINSCSVGKAIQILKEYVGDTGAGETPKLPASKVIKKYRSGSAQPKESTAKKLDDSLMEKFEVDKAALKSWKDEGVSDEVLEKYIVRFDPITNRLVFPIRNFDGYIINVQGRALDPKWKEKGIKKYTHLYSMGTLDTFFGISENIESIGAKREVIIFEGAKSVMQAETWGYTNCIAALTSHINPHQLRLLIMLGVRVVIAFDANVNIYEDKNIMRLKKYCRVEWVKNRDKILEDTEAPVDKGLEVWEDLYGKRVRIN